MLFTTRVTAMSDPPKISIRGFQSASAGTEVTLKAYPENKAARNELDGGAQFEWVINGKTMNRGPIFRCRSKKPATYKVTLNLIIEDRTGKLILADQQHQIVFTSQAQRTSKNTAWELKTKRDWHENKKQRTATTTVSITGRTFVATSEDPCKGTIASRLTWSDPGKRLVPKSQIQIALTEELELIPSVDPDCPPSEGRLSGITSARIVISAPSHYERIEDALTQEVVGTPDYFTKKKPISLRIPKGNPGEEMTLEIGAESAGGSGSSYYTYICRKPTGITEQPSRQPTVKTKTRPAPTPVPKAPPKRLKPLKVNIESSKTHFSLGALVRIQANVKGGKKPYQYAWSTYGVAVEETDSSLSFPLRKPGSCPIAVIVTDAAGTRGADTITFTVDAPAVSLMKDTPPGRRLYLEEPAKLHAELSGVAGESRKDFLFRWRSESETVFNPQESSDPGTTVRFYKTGKTRVWVEAHYRMGNVLTRVAQSKPIEIEVMPPQLQMAFTPSRPYIGQEVKASLSLTPQPKEVEYRWVKVSDNVSVVSKSPDQHEIRFFIKNDQQGEFKAIAMLPRVGDQLGEVTARIRPKRYFVGIEKPIAVGPIPKIWKRGQGLTPLKKLFAAGQELSFTAEISPDPEDYPLSYRWTAEAEALQIKDADTKNAMVTASVPGRYRLKCTVKNSTGIELGNGQIAFTVDVSREDIENGEKQAKAQTLQDEATALIEKKDIESAIAKYQESLAMWPSSEIKKKLSALKNKRASQQEQEALASTLTNEGLSLEQKGKVAEALAKYKESLKTWPDKQVELRIKRVQNAIRERKEKQAYAKGLKRDASSLEERGRFKEAIDVFERSLEAWPDEQVEKHLITLREQLAQKNSNKKQAALLRQEGETAEKDNTLGTAIEKYDASLALWNDDALQKHVWTLKSRAAKLQADKKEAAMLRNEAKKLLEDRQYEMAIAKYKKSLSLAPDEQLATKIHQIEVAWDNRKRKKSEARSLREEGRLLEKNGLIADAIKKYKASIGFWSDTELKQHAADLEGQLAAQTAKKDRAKELEQEGMALEQQGDIYAAITKYEASLQLEDSQRVGNRLLIAHARTKQREKQKSRAAKLRAKGEKLENDGDLAQAILQYQESLTVTPDKILRAHVNEIKEEVARQNTAREAAEKYREEAYRLLLQDDIPGALAKYRESLKAYPNAEVAEHVTKLELQIRETQSRGERAKTLAAGAAELAKKGQIEQAIAKYRKSIEIDPNEAAQKALLDLHRKLAEQQANRAKAADLREKAHLLLLDDQPEAAIKKYKESLQLFPDSEVKKHVKMLEEHLVLARSSALQAKQLADEATQLATEGKLTEAIGKLEESLKISPSEEAQNMLWNLQGKMTGRETVRAKAGKLREEAYLLLLDNKLEQAIAKYRESLKLWPDNDLASHVETLQERLNNRKERWSKARQLEKEARALENSGDLAGAIIKYHESLKAWTNRDLQHHVIELETKARQSNESDQIQERAGELRAQGKQLEEQGDIERAIIKYHASLNLWPDDELQASVEALEQQITELAEQKKRATGLRDEAYVLLTQNKTEEAIKKYKESMALEPDPDLENQIKMLETQNGEKNASRARAKQLAQEAHKQEREGNLQEAVSAYRESLLAYPDRRVRKRLSNLEKKLDEVEARRAQSMQIRDEAHLLVLDNHLEEAIEKYKESMSIWPDELLEKQIAELEEDLRAREQNELLATRYFSQARQLEEKGKLAEAVTIYRKSLAYQADPETETRMRALQEKLDMRKVNENTAKRLWEDGVELVKKHKISEALVILKESLNYSTSPRRAAYVDGLEKRIVRERETKIRKEREAREAEKKVPAPITPAPKSLARDIKISGHPTMAKTRWKGVILAHSKQGTAQWPLRISVGMGNDISGTYQENNPETGLMATYNVGGVYDPSTGIIYMGIRREVNGTTAKATLTGDIKSSETAGGQATIKDTATGGKGIWRLIRMP